MTSPVDPTSEVPRRAAPGEVIRHAFAHTSLGRIVVGMTTRGVCLIAFGDDDRELASELRRRFPRAEIVPTARSAWVDRVVELVEDPPSVDGFPLDIRGTVFQRRVWSALREVPRGETVTYGELARRVGRPASARAVAQACGANPLALVIPCHRAISANGSLRGYRWGIERKRALLERERPTNERRR